MQQYTPEELLETLRSQNLTKINSIKTYDFSAPYTTIPYDKLKSRLFDIIDSVSSIKMEVVKMLTLSLEI